MKKIQEVQTKITEADNTLLSKIDFSDTFATTNHINTIEDVTNMVFNTTPKWVEALFKVRNSAVKLIGLKTGKPSDYSEAFIVGGYIHFFKIYAIEHNKVILGANDSHLNFRAIVINDNTTDYNIKVTTLVEYNNLKGRIYMAIVKPFHRLVVKRMVANAYSN